jgi:hypothetical protein
MLFNPFRATVEQIYRPPTTIFLRHGEVTHVVVLISRGSSNFSKFILERFPLEPSVACQSELSFYLAF